MGGSGETVFVVAGSELIGGSGAISLLPLSLELPPP
jgi:hypothetical protein